MRLENPDDEKEETMAETTTEKTMAERRFLQESAGNGIGSLP